MRGGESYRLCVKIERVLTADFTGKEGLNGFNACAESPVSVNVLNAQPPSTVYTADPWTAEGIEMQHRSKQ